MRDSPRLWTADPTAQTAHPNAGARARGEDWAPAFLHALERSATVSEAARAAGVGRRTAYDRRKRDEEFAQAWDDTLESAIEQLEAEAVRRAKDGSDGLLMFLLRARRPEVYSERHRIHHSGQVVPVSPSVVLTPEGAQAAHEFLDKVREARNGDEAREALSDCLRKRPAERRP